MDLYYLMKRLAGNRTVKVKVRTVEAELIFTLLCYKSKVLRIGLAAPNISARRPILPARGGYNGTNLAEFQWQVYFL